MSQIVPLTSQDMLSVWMFVVKKKNVFLTKNENHNLDTRQIIYTFLKQTSPFSKKVFYYSGIKFFYNLPLEIKNIAGNKCTRNKNTRINDREMKLRLTHLQTSYVAVAPLVSLLSPCSCR